MAFPGPRLHVTPGGTLHPSEFQIFHVQKGSHRLGVTLNEMRQSFSNWCLATNPLLKESLQGTEEKKGEDMEAGSEPALLGTPYPTLVVPEGTPSVCVTVFENLERISIKLPAHNGRSMFCPFLFR